MGNIGSHTGQISGGLRAELRTKKERDTPPEPWEPPSCHRSPPPPQIKVLPDLESKQRLRHTNNGDILQSGGTLSGRHQTPLHNAYIKLYSPSQKTFYHNGGIVSPLKNRPNVTSQKSLNNHLKLCRSEPDLRLSMTQEMQEKKNRKKYKAPMPPTNRQKQEKSSSNWESKYCEQNPLKRARIFKTREQTKKESSHSSTLEHNVENISEILEEKINARENANYMRPRSFPDFNFHEANDFQAELKKAAQHRLEATAKLDEAIRLKEEHDHAMEDRFLRGEPSGKESSTPEASPILGIKNNHQKPKEFYFGMDREDSDESSCYPVEDDDENNTIALSLRPVLPRKPTQIPRFSPAVAWKLLDSRSQDSGISAGDARPPLTSWTPQQDLEDDSSMDDAIREEPKSVTRQRPYVFSLSLPRDHQPSVFMTMNCNRSGMSSLQRLKTSVSGVLNTFPIRRDYEKRSLPKEDEDSNWFFTRSAPNSLNENLPDISDTAFPHISSNARLIYLPETEINMIPVANKYGLSTNFSKSCEELRVPESLQDRKNSIEMPWSKETRVKKAKKFTFQSTIRQIERKRMADKLSKEAERKEKQRLREVEAMRRVEEEFQKKRAREKANIRQQLRIYALDPSLDQWESLPFDVNIKTEERQEPEGAVSSSNSSTLSPAPLKSQRELSKNKLLEGKLVPQVTQELSEYRQMQRSYKEYRGQTKYTAENRHVRQTTVHPEVTCNMPNSKGLNIENDNYRKDFAYGLKSTKSIGSNQSEDSQNNPSQTIYCNKYSPITRF